MKSEELATKLETKQESSVATNSEPDLKKPPADYLKSLQPLGMEDKEKVG